MAASKSYRFSSYDMGTLAGVDAVEFGALAENKCFVTPFLMQPDFFLQAVSDQH